MRGQQINRIQVNNIRMVGIRMRSKRIVSINKWNRVPRAVNAVCTGFTTGHSRRMGAG